MNFQLETDGANLLCFLFILQLQCKIVILLHVSNINSARSNVQTRKVKHNRFKLTAYALFKDKKFLT